MFSLPLIFLEGHKKCRTTRFWKCVPYNRIHGSGSGIYTVDWQIFTIVLIHYVCDLLFSHKIKPIVNITILYFDQLVFLGLEIKTIAIGTF